MIARITAGKSYFLNNRYCTVVEVRRGAYGWSPDMVRYRYQDGEIGTMLAGQFRKRAEK